MFSFAELYDCDFDLEQIFAMPQNFWRPGNAFAMKTPRATHALVYGVSFEADCVTPTGTLSFSDGDLIYIPKGSVYTWYPKMESETILFEFDILPRDSKQIRWDTQVRAVTAGNASAYRHAAESLLREYIRPQPMRAAVREKAYAYLAEVIRNERSEVLRRSLGNDSLYRAIRYLENDELQQDSIEEIARMCGMSLSAFEKQFKAYAGQTPQAFRLERKLDKAERLIRAEAMTLDRIAEILGFCDGAYLCRILKKKRGVTPAGLRK